jgi:hypothetical protein
MTKDDRSRKEWANALVVNLKENKNLNKNVRSAAFYQSFTAVITHSEIALMSP